MEHLIIVHENLGHTISLQSSRFGETLRNVQDHLNSQNFYAFNPSFDIPQGPQCNPQPQPQPQSGLSNTAIQPNQAQVNQNGVVQSQPAVNRSVPSAAENCRRNNSNSRCGCGYA